MRPMRKIGATLLLGLVACGAGRCGGGGGAPDATSLSPAPSAEAIEAGGVPVDTVSAASSAWEAGAPISRVAGEVDGAALRARNRARLAADASPVNVLTGDDLVALGMAACEAVVPRRSKDTPVLVKPNLGGFEWFKDPSTHDGDDGVRGRTTDPEIVRGVVRCLKARGHSRITIAEGWGAKHADWQRLVRVSGYEAMARDEGVPLVAMDDDGVFDEADGTPGKPVRVRGMEATHAPTLLMPKILAEHAERGLFISVPKIKAHRFGVFSVALKGMQGTVMLSDASPAFRQKWRMHRELGPALTLLGKEPERGRAAYLDALQVFAERMTDVLEVAAPDAVIADGAPAMGGDGFQKLWPSAESFVVAGTNAVRVDRVAAQTLGLWDNASLAEKLGGHRTSPLLEVAAKRLGVDLAKVEITGSGAHLATSPRPVHYVSMAGFSILSDGAPPASPREYRRRGSAGDAADAGPPDAAAPAPEGPTARAIRFAAPPTIDGVADAAWRSASAVAWDTDWSGASRGVRTTARLGWDPTALYALFELEGADVNVDASRPVGVERERLYEEDCVELFVGTDAADRSRYFELEVGPLGHFLDVAIDRGGKRSDVAWSSRAEIATKVDRPARRVVVEVAVRAPEIVKALRAGARLPLALYRMEGKAPRLYLAWSPTRTPRPNFHVPERFGELLLE